MVDPNTWQVARVQRVIRETPRAVTLRLDVADWPVGRHRAGQRIDVRLTAEDGYQATRAYSIASPPQWAQVDVTVEEIMDGEVSPYLVEDVQVGDELEVRGPIGGAFTWRPADGGPLLLVGGGSGVVPLMAMLRAHAEERSDTDVRLLLSARTQADALYLDELDRLSDDGLVRRHVTLTRQPAPPGWSGSTQRVGAAMLAELGPSPAASPLVFVCGPTGFVESVSDALLALGHHPGAIRTERFGPSS